MSSFSGRRLSMLIVKLLFSQMGPGQAAKLWKLLPGLGPRRYPEYIQRSGEKSCQNSNTTSLSVAMRGPRARRAAPAHATEAANCTPSCNTGEGGRPWRQGAHQQIRLPGPVRARPDGGGLSRSGLVRQRPARGRGGDCRRALGRRPARRAPAHGRGMPEQQKLPTPRVKRQGTGNSLLPKVHLNVRSVILSERDPERTSVRGW